MHIRVALEAILIHLQRVRRNERARGRACERREEVLLARSRPRSPPLAGIARVHEQHRRREDDNHRGEATAHLPLDAWSGKSMQDEEPDGDRRGQYVGPVDDAACVLILDFGNAVDASEQQTADEQYDCHREQCVTDPDGSPVATVVRVAEVEDPENDDRQNDHQSEHQVDEEHELVEVILQDLTAIPLGEGDGRQVARVDREQGEETEDDHQELAEARSDGRDVFPHRRLVLSHRDAPDLPSRRGGVRSSSPVEPRA